MQGVLETGRLVLRALAPGDAEPMASHCADLEATRWLSRVPHPFARADAEAFLAGIGARDGQHWAVTTRGAGRIGVIALDAEPEGPSLGYWLGRAHWGQGFRREAARAVVAAAVAAGATQLVSGAFEGNAASLAIQRRLGFRETGRRPLHSRALGAARTQIDTALSQADWEAAA